MCRDSCGHLTAHRFFWYSLGVELNFFILRNLSMGMNGNCLCSSWDPQGVHTSLPTAARSSLGFQMSQAQFVFQAQVLGSSSSLCAQGLQRGPGVLSLQGQQCPGGCRAPQGVPAGLDPSQAMRLQREMLHIWQPALELCGAVWCKTKPNARKLTSPH